jgi:vesicle-associated membrane protein 72
MNVSSVVFSQAQDFRQHGTQIRRKMWWQNMKIKLIVLAILIVLILIIVLSICGGFKC